MQNSPSLSSCSSVSGDVGRAARASAAAGSRNRHTAGRPGAADGRRLARQAHGPPFSSWPAWAALALRRFLGQPRAVVAEAEGLEKRLVLNFCCGGAHTPTARLGDDVLFPLPTRLGGRRFGHCCKFEAFLAAHRLRGASKPIFSGRRVAPKGSSSSAALSTSPGVGRSEATEPLRWLS